MNLKTLIRPNHLFVVAALAVTFVCASRGQAQSLTASITYPANDAVNADLSQPITWTSVENVQKYYLYLGTSIGAKDLVDTGGIQATSYLAAGLPSDQTVYARIWAQVGGVWRYTDSTFSAAASAPLTATLTYPANGAVNANLSQPITWTTVANVQKYYLYVGTSVGANDLVNTGGILSTSYLAAGLPSGQTLYARIWTQVAGVWRYTDSTFSAANSAPLTATLTYPSNGAVNANLSQPITWTTVANVQKYYLYVGTSVGAKDLVDTGGILSTSYLAAGLPSSQTLYARIWTQVGGVWRYTDSTFSVAPPVTATLTYPANGAVNADLSQPITWTTVANVQKYYLYVGTSVGAKDLVDTGGILSTSFLAAGLPSGQTLHARIWAQVGGVWRYTDSTFSAANSTPLTATLTYPANGAVGADMSQPFQWTTVANVQAYYLYVGTTAGGNNLVSSGEIQQTSYQAASLPAGQTLYARLWAKVGNIWRYTESAFTASPQEATLIFPADGAVAIDQMQPVTWTSVTNAEGYYLYIGSTPGAKDLRDSGQIHSTSLSISDGGPPLPAGTTLYARIWTRKVGGVWVYRDSTFTASLIAPTFLYPLDGAIGVANTQPFEWTPPSQASTHELHIGTSPGATDVFNSGQIDATSISVPTLPVSGTLYARALSLVGSVWRYTDIAFTSEASLAAAAMVLPADGEVAFDTGYPFQWSDVPLARGYRLTIGTTPGGSDLHDSGEIHVTRRFVPALPAGALFGRIETKIDGQWLSLDFTFTVAANSVSTAVQIQSALWATDLVRRMAQDDNHPFSWTDLASRRFFVYCADYSSTLLQVWAEMNGQLPARRLDVALNPNSHDAHTLVEMFNAESQSWMLFDPTFDLAVRRASDNEWATAEEVSAATQNQQWADVAYEFLGSGGDHYATSYILDYPLLFANVYHTGQLPVPGVGNPVLPYMDAISMPVAGTSQAYAIGCGNELTAVVRIDNLDQVVACDGVDGLSYVFFATTIEKSTQTSDAVVVYRPKRYVF